MSTDRVPLRILCVDDHPLLREGVTALLASQPDMMLVAEASNGREASEQFRKHRPDVTLIDLQMPEMNGVDALIAICAEFPAARFIVLTTYTGDVQVMCALRAGAPASTWPERLRFNAPDFQCHPAWDPRRRQIRSCPASKNSASTLLR